MEISVNAQYKMPGACQSHYRLTDNKIFRDGKVKAIPAHDWRGPEDSKSLRISDFKTIGT
jgi:hypothetical protein